MYGQKAEDFQNSSFVFSQQLYFDKKQKNTISRIKFIKIWLQNLYNICSYFTKRKLLIIIFIDLVMCSIWRPCSSLWISLNFAVPRTVHRSRYRRRSRSRSGLRDILRFFILRYFFIFRLSVSLVFFAVSLVRLRRRLIRLLSRLILSIVGLIIIGVSWSSSWSCIVIIIDFQASWISVGKSAMDNPVRVALCCMGYTVFSPVEKPKSSIDFRKVAAVLQDCGVKWLGCDEVEKQCSNEGLKIYTLYARLLVLNNAIDLFESIVRILALDLAKNLLNQLKDKLGQFCLNYWQLN